MDFFGTFLQFVSGKGIILVIAVGAWSLVRPPRPPWARWLGYQLCLALVVELTAEHLSRSGVMNHWVYNVYAPLEFLLIGGLFLAVEGDRRSVRLRLGICTLLFFAGFLIDLVSKGTVQVFASNAVIFGGALIALNTGIALIHCSRTSPVPLYRLPEFWALIGLLMYFLCFLPVFGLYNHLVERNPALAMRVYGINMLLYILRYALAATSLVMLRIHRARP